MMSAISCWSPLRSLLLLLKGQFTLARIGGDEFVLLAEAEGPDDAASLANSLVRAIDSPFNLDPMNWWSPSALVSRCTLTTAKPIVS
jgi:GGDEF domain-containing protein